MQLTFNRIAAVSSVFALVLLASADLNAQSTSQPTDPTARTTSRPASSQPGKDETTGDRVVVTRHSLKLGERTLNFTATTGTMAQKDESGKPLADMFFVAYALDDDAGAAPTNRPITFVFNGGPGAASVWLHLGAVGPKRIKLDDNGMPTSPPFELVDNESTWLDATDLVFIDPVGTGYSRPAEGVKGEQFFGVEEDVKSVGNFIRLYITRYERWPSPKFLAGESYGTTRAAGLSEHLLEKQGISLNGIVLISAVLNFQTIVGGNGNELPYPLFVPTYTAAAAYHKKLSPELSRDLDATLLEVTRWAKNEYTAALMQGDALTDDARQKVAEQLARYTGLSIDYVQKANLRIDPGRFRKELLAGQRMILGRFDARVTGFTSDPLNDNPNYDPSASLFLPVYAANLNDFVRRELKFESDLPYEVLTERVNPWNWGHDSFGYLYVADTLRDTVLKNPQLKILFAAGTLDLATPFAASDYTIDHLTLPPELRKNFTRTYYPAGHMMYHDTGSRQKLHEDVVSFIRSAENAGK